MKLHSYYISGGNADQACIDTELSFEELRDMVGEFPVGHKFVGLKGQVWVYEDKVQVRHHFTKKKLWEARYEYL